ncbi:MAG: hypothetical protein HY863_00105 [Chloroflexi bacterium]|nr:hypothetical protein [Chloroflexota bacterium]
MKKILLISLVFVLAACGVAPVQQVQPTAVIATVLVPVNQPTEVPPTAQVIVVTATSEPATPVPPPAQVIVVTATNAPVANVTSGGSITLDDILGRGVFSNMTMSGDTLTLRCTPREITFTAKANLPEIVDALLYYRIVDNPVGLYPSEWQNGGKMTGDGNGNFTIVFGGDDVNENLRLDKAWLDIQFIGLNKGGAAVDRTEKIEKLITYLKDCP